MFQRKSLKSQGKSFIALRYFRSESYEKTYPMKALIAFIFYLIAPLHKSFGESTMKHQHALETGQIVSCPFTYPVFCQRSFKHLSN